MGMGSKLFHTSQKCFLVITAYPVNRSHIAEFSLTPSHARSAFTRRSISSSSAENPFKRKASRLSSGLLELLMVEGLHLYINTIILMYESDGAQSRPFPHYYTRDNPPSPVCHALKPKTTWTTLLLTLRPKRTIPQPASPSKKSPAARYCAKNQFSIPAL